jgi:hypothetical protein
MQVTKLRIITDGKMEKITGKFDEKDKSVNFAIIAVFLFSAGLFCLELFGISKNNLAGNILIFCFFGISLTLFAIAVFNYFTPVSLEFSTIDGMFEVKASRLNKPIKTYKVLKWDICILNIAEKYKARIALAIKISTDRESFYITEDVDGTKIYGYPIVSWGYYEKYSSNTPGTVAAVVKMLEGKKNPQLTTQESIEKYY